MSKSALIVHGGWDGHEPELISKRFEGLLKADGFSVDVSDSLDAFLDQERLRSLDLIVPVWTMGKITKEQVTPVINAVADGVGIAGCHGGLCDAFRECVEWQFMTGGNWVSHPGGDGVEYTVNIKNSSSPIVQGIEDFKVKTEHYYLLVDPAIEVLAVTHFPNVKWFHSSNGTVEMPVVWTKRWGAGRVFYSSLGHHNDVFDTKEALEIMHRGLLWAAEGKQESRKAGIDINKFNSSGKMF